MFIDFKHKEAYIYYTLHRGGHQMLKSKITKHADKRIQERIGLPKRARDRIAEKVYRDGLTHKEATGRLHDYFTYLYHKNHTINNIRIYNNQVFLFADTTLVTVLNLPSAHKNAVNKILSRRIKISES